MPRTHLDHITIVAPTLAAGIELVRATLGVMPEVGGEHPSMGTHNYLLRLGENIFLEVIAINPHAPRPPRCRWFELDRVMHGQSPRLAAWVARTDDIEAASAASQMSLGHVEPMSRGSLNWLISILPDGSLPLHGIAPTLIEWPPNTHPASMLNDSGCTLVRLEGFHPDPAKVKSILECIGFEDDVRISPLSKGERPYLVAHIKTPSGLRYLSC